MTIRRWWARQLWGVAQTPNETDDLRADLRREVEDNRRLSAYVADLEGTTATLMQMNLQNEATIKALRERVELAEYMRDIVAQCRDDAYVAMARDSVP